MSESLAPVRISLLVMVLFGVVSLALASVGLYAVIAFGVRQRSREIGIRIALGQTPGHVRRLILGQGLRLVLAGSVPGVAAAAALGRLASAYLFRVDSFDPVTYLTAIGVLTGTAVLACWIPARRAGRIDPIEALRVE